MADFIASFNKLSLQEIAGASENLFPDLSDEEKALGSQAQTLSTKLDEEHAVISLNDHLRTKTFVSGNRPSKYDLVVFQKVLPVASKWKSPEEWANFRHILRWADLVQNTLVEVSPSEVLQINYDIEIPKEVKEKKKATKENKDEAPAIPAPKSKKGHLNEDEKKAIAEAQKAKKAAKAKARAEQQAKQQAEVIPPNPSMIDFRVGFIQKAVKHPNADSLYMSTIDMGDSEGPRTVCSGLVKYVPLEDMQERYVICVANLKPVTMRGVKSCAMVLCASKDDTIEFVNPPAGSKPGDKIFFEGYDGTPEKQLNPKKKVWETLQPRFSTTENFEVTYTEEGKEPKRLVNSKGELCKNSTIAKADVK